MTLPTSPAACATRLTPAPGCLASAEIEEKRSRFITALAYVSDESAARSLVAAARSIYPDARHHCSAFILPGQGAVSIERSSDDGEPAGTAGIPMLDTLRGAGLTNVAAVVTRYFGGTLLGRGGLVRAYAEAVEAALAQTPVVTWGQLRRASLAVPHAVAGRLEADLRARGIEVTGTEYGAQATLHVAVAPERASFFTDLVASLSAGELSPTWGETDWVRLD
ncbi:YigZ family protein [Buchananella felis]|uniref:IMPACT family protein n=1 Tax=Buchananella felis TaxID=3231492 RepID=UPI00352904FB